MKKIALLLILLPFFGLSQQLNKTVSSSKNKEIDLSKIAVEYINKDANTINESVVFLVNGKQYPSSTIRTIKPDLIKNINVIKESTTYPKGAVEIELDNNLSINLISLKELLNTETNHKLDNNLFFIDDDLIEFKASEYFVDKNNILRIVIKPINSADLNYNSVKIYTKSEKNINDLKNPKLIIR